jgi:hypothetical protein
MNWNHVADLDARLESILACDLAFLVTGQIVLLLTGSKGFKDSLSSAEHVKEVRRLFTEGGVSSSSSTAGLYGSGVERSPYIR